MADVAEEEWWGGYLTNCLHVYSLTGKPRRKVSGQYLDCTLPLSKLNSLM